MFSANENIQLRQYKRQIVAHVESCIPDDVLDLGVNVMVMQVSCQAPGCVPLETAIIIVFPHSNVELLPGLPESQGGSYKTKILKPMMGVTKQDVLEALPPQFPGGLRSMEQLCITARDTMLAQVHQLFDDTEGRRLLAQYLQQSLQHYMDRDCVAPEWGEDFPDSNKKEVENKSDDNKKEAVENGAEKQESKDEMEVNLQSRSTGNVVIRRPIDDDDTDGEMTTFKSSLQTVGTSSNSVSVDSVTRQRQQQAASSQLLNQSTILSRLAEREHAPGLRRPGCPCCDPDHPSNVIDQMMQL